MNNIKTVTVGTDGNAKRVIVTYDVIDDTGKTVRPNMKVNRIVTDEQILNVISQLEEYAAKIIE